MTQPWRGCCCIASCAPHTVPHNLPTHHIIVGATVLGDLLAVHGGVEGPSESAGKAVHHKENVHNAWRCQDS